MVIDVRFTNGDGMGDDESLRIVHACTVLHCVPTDDGVVNIAGRQMPFMFHVWY